MTCNAMNEYMQGHLCYDMQVDSMMRALALALALALPLPLPLALALGSAL